MDEKTVAIVRGITVREPTDEILLEQTGMCELSRNCNRFIRVTPHGKEIEAKKAYSKHWKKTSVQRLNQQSLVKLFSATEQNNTGLLPNVRNMMQKEACDFMQGLVRSVTRPNWSRKISESL